MTSVQTSVAPVPEAVEALVDHARDLRIRAHELRNGESADSRAWANPLVSQRIVGYEVAAALNEVAAALLRCA